jgi:excisionase family DNA binding protein
VRADTIYWTVAEIATRLRLSKPDTILAAIHAGGLAAVNVSGGVRPTWRVAEADLQRWLDSRRAVPVPPVTRRRKRPRAAAVTAYF